MSSVLVSTNEHSKSGSTWFKGIDSLRFIFALIVILGHLRNPIADSLKQSNNILFKYAGTFLSVSFVGPAAVIAFFIISGFVIHFPNKDGISNIKEFYIRRYVRILIPLLAILSIGQFLGNADSVIIWSLICELIYYTIYPFLLAVKVSWKYQILVAYVLCFILIFFLAQNEIRSMVNHRDIGYNGGYVQLGYFITWLIGLPTWLLGVYLADHIGKVNENIPFSKMLLYRTAIFLLPIVCSILRFHYFTSYILTLPILTLPIYFWIKKEIIYYKNQKPVLLLENGGKFSYSLYLCHPIIFTALGALVPLNIISYFAYIIFTIAFSYIFYKLVEYPSHLLAKKLTKKKIILATA